MNDRINVLIPLAGRNTLFSLQDYPYSKPLIEVEGKSIIQMTIENLQTINKDIHFIFLVRTEDCKKFFLDQVLRIITDNKCTIIKIEKDTKGALCTALMAIEDIDNESPLIISNGDQILREDLNNILGYLSKFDAGVVSFESVHPRWSFIRTEGKMVVETAEKRPISQNAIAGFFYFEKGSYFVKSGMETIKKDANYNNMFYISSTFNELILENKSVGFYKIANEKYDCFYSPEKIKEYENRRNQKLNQ
jgi:dTDP-glucose pyrophosphorylase